LRCRTLARPPELLRKAVNLSQLSAGDPSAASERIALGETPWRRKVRDRTWGAFGGALITF
jgi:hypothetical protein